MDLVEYLGTKKLNELIIENPYNAAGVIDIAAGKHNQRGLGFLGQRVRLSEKQALKQSNTTIGTLYNCVIQLVRIQPDFGTVNLTDIIVGRPLFWNDTKKFLVTPLASATAKLAGIAITNLTANNNKGDIIPVVVSGEVGMLGKAAAFTKAAPAINDPIVLSIAANLATLDVLADATGWTNVQLALRVGRTSVSWAGGAGTVVKGYLDNAFQVLNDGVM